MASKLLHNPTFEELIEMAKNSDKKSRQEEAKIIANIPVKTNKIGVQNIEKLYTHNIMESIISHNHFMRDSSGFWY